MSNLPKSLCETLRGWQVAPPADAGFRPAVWSRIEGLRRAATETWFGYFRRHAIVWSLVLLSTAAGAGLLGREAGERRAVADHTVILDTYLAQIDARVMHR
ncbi:MAG TPA: hypothetical protein VK178_04160 [Opitutaceae bacterium]|nr:hypothetical protein [Opitutaceae bacterium]